MKTYKLYTFDSVTKVMQAEIYLEEDSIPVRMVPILPEIDAGCGLALRIDEKNQALAENALKKRNLDYEDRYKLVYRQGEKSPEVVKYDLP